MWGDCHETYAAMDTLSFEKGEYISSLCFTKSTFVSHHSLQISTLLAVIPFSCPSIKTLTHFKNPCSYLLLASASGVHLKLLIYGWSKVWRQHCSDQQNIHLCCLAQPRAGWLFFCIKMLRSLKQVQFQEAVIEPSLVVHYTLVIIGSQKESTAVWSIVVWILL